VQFNSKALLVFVGFGGLVAMAVSSNGGGWFPVAEAVASVFILLGLAGFLSQSTPRAR